MPSVQTSQDAGDPRRHRPTAAHDEATVGRHDLRDVDDHFQPVRHDDPHQRRSRLSAHRRSATGEHTVTGASHDATRWQSRLPSLAAWVRRSVSWSSGTAWSVTGSWRRLRSRDGDDAWWVTVLAEERDAAYDRVGLTGYTEHWDRSRLALPGNDYAGDDRVELILRDRVTADRHAPRST